MELWKKTYSLPYLNKILNISTTLFLINLFLFASFLFKDIFLDPHFAGDEIKYLKDLINANEFGLSRAIGEGASITYLVISYYFDRLINHPLFTLKFTSLIFGTLMFISLVLFSFKNLKVEGVLKYQSLLWIGYLFIIQTTIFSGVNDILLDFFGTLLFISFFLRFKSTTLKYILMGLWLALMLATRKMAITYIFVFFLIFVFNIFYSKNNINFNFKNGLLTGFSFILFFLLLNIHPLLEHNIFSFDDKILGGSVNWAQWDYHNAILINQGEQERFHHVNIEETKKYLVENGQHSLPSTFLEMIFFDPQLTIKEFFIDSITGLKYIFRQTGLLTLTFIFFLLHRIKKIHVIKSVSKTDFMYLFCMCYFFIICFIVIANIQARWFMLFMPFMILLISKDLNKFSQRKQILFSSCNNVILTIMCFPYLFEKIMKLF